MLLFSCSLIGTAHAADTPLSQGLVSFKRGDWAAAEKHFTAAVKGTSRRGDALALLGMTEFHLARYSKAEANLSRALEIETSYAPRALYYLGMTRAKLGKQELATATFRELISEHPESSEANKLRASVKDLKPSILRRDAFLFTGMIASCELGYSSNPSRTSDGESDFYIGAFASSDLELNPAWTLGGSIFAEKYEDDDDNDFMDLTIDLTRRHSFSDGSRLFGTASAEMSWLGGDAYERTLAARFVHTRLLSRLYILEVRLGLESIADISDDGDADGSAISSRLRLTRPSLTRSLLRRTRVELEWESEDNDVERLGSSEVTVGAECRLAPYANTSLDCGIAYSSIAYDGQDPTDLVARDDSAVELSASWLIPKNKSTYFTVELSHEMRSSNISYYDADETLLTAGVLFFP